MTERQTRLLVQPGLDDFDRFMDLAAREHYGLELTAFAHPNVLADPSLRDRVIDDYTRKLAGFGSPLSLHGPFLDLLPHSRDPMVARVAADRIGDALEIASVMGCQYAVFHAGYNPLIKNPSYRKGFVKRQSDFWRLMLDRFPRMNVLIENVWEPDPELLLELLVEIESPRLKICLDTGHVNAFSATSLDAWLVGLADHLVYVHLNDNHGVADDELPPGEGEIDWRNFFGRLGESNLSPLVTIEVGGFDATEAAIRYLKAHQYYPFCEEH